MIAATAILAATNVLISPYIPHKPVAPTNYASFLISQASYRGYLTCEESRTRNCEIELNRRRTSVKDLCYSIWTNNWPERYTLDPSTVALYINWCGQASEDIDFAEREFSPLIKYVNNYRRSEIKSLDSGQTIDATLANSRFLAKCASKSAERASRAMQLWGTREYGDWTIRKLDLHSPTRYKEVLSACDRKSWARKLAGELKPIAASAWLKRDSDLSKTECTAPETGENWSSEKLELNSKQKDAYIKFVDQSKSLSQLINSPLSQNEEQVTYAINSYTSKARNCDEIIASGELEVERVQAAEQKLIRDKAAKAARLRRQEAAAAEVRRREAAARKLQIEAQRQKEDRLKEAVNSVQLD